MTRRLLNLLTALSLILCAATVALWARSYVVAGWVTGQRVYRVDAKLEGVTT